MEKDSFKKRSRVKTEEWEVESEEADGEWWQPSVNKNLLHNYLDYLNKTIVAKLFRKNK